MLTLRSAKYHKLGLEMGCEQNFSVLIVDDEEDIRDLFDFCVRGAIPSQVIHASNGEEAIKILGEKKIDLVVCDYVMPEAGGGEVYQFVLNKKLPTLFVLASTNKPSELAEFSDRSALYDYIEKPDVLNQFRMMLGKLKTEMFSTKQDRPQLYTPVSIALLLKIAIMPSAIFIRLTAEKFVKILDRGQTFDDTDYLKYVQKDLNELYCSNLEVEQILESIKNRIIAIQALRAEPSLDATMQVHAILVGTFKDFGLRESFAPYVQKQIEDTVKLFEHEKKFTDCLNKILRMRGFYIGTHSFLLAAITSIMTTKLNWASDAPNVKLVIASLMHDIFLNEDLSNETSLLNQRTYSEDFLSHPQKAADFVNSISTVPPDTAKIILEQHEIGEINGIPKAMNLARVSTLGALFSFSHHLVDFLISEHEKGPIVPDVIYSKMSEIASNSSHYTKFLKVLREVRIFQS